MGFMLVIKEKLTDRKKELEQELTRINAEHNDLIEKLRTIEDNVKTLQDNLVAVNNEISDKFVDQKILLCRQNELEEYLVVTFSDWNAI
ncbi:hypothetical protein DM860_010339 [Cuscuta australis]|uniref:Uncharacterized protein n=1 Tax=Cuscuta australis TaxID=267555 RepID=A0A328D747_9ASTE|nr:hypothetical protein DM860_010339 [Cuscuta australis]